MRTIEHFERLMQERYHVKNLVGLTPAEFQTQINQFLQLKDGKMEGFQDEDKQRDLAIKFHWGHNQDFGAFKLEGKMGRRHLDIPAFFLDQYQGFPLDLKNKKVLDIGVWTGGTSLLLCALGAEVVAIEEVKKYVLSVEFLKKAFGLSNLTVLNKSLYDLNTPEFFDQFDFVLFSGVIYHVTDPVLALRITFNVLKDGGNCLVESAAIAEKRPIVSYEGPDIYATGSKKDLNRSGWNWFIPSPSALAQMMKDVGFDNVRASDVLNGRVLAAGRRTTHCDMNRAGLSVRNVR